MRTCSFVSIYIFLMMLYLSPVLSEVDTDRWTYEPWVRDVPSNSSADEGPMPELASFSIETNPPALSIGGMELPYKEYASRTRSNELWIDCGDGKSWSQYAVSSAGKALDVVAYSPRGGRADVYRIDYSHNATYHRQYDLIPGYSSGEIALTNPGRVMMLMAVNDQPSNAIIIDVTPEETSSPGPADLNNFRLGEARLTVTSVWLKGFDVYVDEVYRTSDQKDGKEDGNATLEVWGGRTHTITVAKIGGLSGSPYKSEYVKKFDSGIAYTLRI